ncbi:hypothetical protein LTR35_014469 [Friedmanniomyces endolithicus]|uniref:Uncharacterized protein n=1 Tax=Friedmanniomyces endolithicus TaxID=329885 RepID=A0AAN6FAT6_9PEZI|nr:hypothetical protein LTR35_014469 [Friedmanniomyces endolithicus]KAK0279287.1 hypothetical protein LTS00_013392 [Friedmanniomyces endolithicus]KAK0312456.1 hypothetical protein LTR82_013926 [Friedmanniomyces endolithicus]KAK0988755.1 hypothetical protein LTR54_012715 [Friedmanniomyces endolithicus]
MAAVDLEEIRKKYKFNQITVATWRNLSGSILPARGGPQSLVISAEAAGKPFIPSYKVRYPLPQPTDDEDSEGGEDSESEREDAPLEVLAGEENPGHPDDVDELLHEGHPDDVIKVIDESVDTAQGPVVADRDTFAAVTSVPLIDGIEPSETEIKPAIAIDYGGCVDAADEEDEAGYDQSSSQEEDDNAIAVPEHESIPPPPAPSPPPVEAFDANDGRGFASGIPGSFPISTEALPEVDAAALTEKPEAVEDISDVPPSPAGDRSVHFAPGTPEPKPTVRKKKSAKGPKQKSKKRASVVVENPPDDIVAIVDEATGEGPQPVSGSSHDAAVDEVILIPDHEGTTAEPVTIPNGKDIEDKPECGPVTVDNDPVAEPHIAPVEATSSGGAADLPLDDLAPGDGSEHVDVVPAVDVPPPAIVDPIETSKPKKKSSKTSSKGKEKSEKKFSRSKVKDMIQSIEVRGVDVVPPAPVPDLDDTPKDILPAPQPPVVEPDNVETSGLIEEANQDFGKAETSPAVPVDIATTDDAHSPLDDASVPNIDTDVTRPLNDATGSDPGATHNDRDAAVEETSSQEVGFVQEPDIKNDESDDEHAIDGVVEVTEPEPGAVCDPPVTSMEIDEWQRSGDELSDLHEDELFASYDEPDDIVSFIADDDQQVLDTKSEAEGEIGSHREEDVGTATSETGDDPQMLGDPMTETMDANPASNDEELTLVDEAAAGVGTSNVAEHSAVSQPECKEPIDDEPSMDAFVAEMTEPEGIAVDAPAAESFAGDDQPNETNLEVQGDNDLVDRIVAEEIHDEVTVEIPQCDPDLPVDETADASADVEAVNPPPVDEATEAIQQEVVLEEASVAVIDVANKMQPEGETALLEGAPIERNIVESFDEPDNDPMPGAATESPLTSPVAPPSPTLSKGGSYKHRTDHWQRKHDSKRVSTDAKPEKASPSKRNSGNSREEPRSADRPHRSRRQSQPTEDETERRRQKEARKAEESARIREEERKMAEEDEARRIRHEARRARRKAAAEEEAEAMRQKAETIAYREAEARRRRHKERERSGETARPRRTRRESVTKAPLFFRTGSDQPSERRRGNDSARGSRNDDRPVSKPSSSPAPLLSRAEEPLVGPSGQSASVPADAGPPSSSGSPVAGRVSDLAEDR